MSIKKILFLMAAAMFSVMAAAQNSATLKLNPEKNKVYRFSSSSEQTIIQTVNGNQQTIESTTIYAVSIKMMDATPAFLIAEVRFDTLSTKTNTMGKTANMTSASEGDLLSKETSDIMSYFMNRLSRNSLYAKIDYTGKVIEIVNGKMVSDMVMKDTSSITLTGPMRNAINSQVKNMVSDNSLTTIIEMFTFYLPGKQVSVGESWSHTISTNAGGMSLDIATSSHLDGISGSNASITSESNIKASPNAVPMESMGARITYDDIQGLSKSNETVDMTTGFIIEGKSKTHIAGNLGLTMPGMSMQIPMDINSESRVFAIK